MNVNFRFNLEDRVKANSLPEGKPGITSIKGEVIALEVSKRGTVAVVATANGGRFRELESNLSPA